MVDLSAKDRIIVALDVPTENKAWDIFSPLRSEVGAFKVGLEAIMAGIAHEIAKTIILEEEKVFWDGKFNDIPNTSMGATSAVNERLIDRLWAVNVHANSGPDSVAQVVEKRGNALVLAVTLLTSIKPEQCLRMFGAPPEVIVPRWAEIALESGVQGIICSPQEVSLLRKELGDDFLIVTPGIRPLESNQDDQARAATPREAILNGADILVVGRPITAASNPVEAARKIASEIDQALKDRAA